MSYLLVAAIFEAQLPRVAVLRAATAAEGIRLARAFEPDLLLLDLRLPDQPGLEVIRELNREIATGAFALLVVTADKTTSDVVKARALGAREVLFKPIHIEQFLGAVTSALRHQAAAAALAPGSAGGRGPDLTAG